MANGLRPYLLGQVKDITGSGAYPGYKVDYHGTLNMLLANQMNKPIPIDTSLGMKNELRAWYRQRPTVSMTDTAKSCDNVLTPARKETTLAVNNVRQYAAYLGDEVMATYTDEAAQNMAFGQTVASQEMMDNLFAGTNAIAAGINQDVIGLITWGRNRVNNVSTAVTLNIPQTVTAQPLDNGIPKLVGDYKNNQLSGRPQIVGSGFMHNFVLSQPWKGLDTGGVDTRMQASLFDFWPDQDIANSSVTGNLGTNGIAVFEPGSIHLTEYNEYTGFKRKSVPGLMEFFNVPMPSLDPTGNFVPFNVDVQFKYHDCATTLTDAYSGSSTTYEKGWVMIISKRFGLWQIPSDSYRNDDPQIAVNGALRYTITNS